MPKPPLKLGLVPPLPAALNPEALKPVAPERRSLVRRSKFRICRLSKEVPRVKIEVVFLACDSVEIPGQLAERLGAEIVDSNT